MEINSFSYINVFSLYSVDLNKRYNVNIYSLIIIYAIIIESAYIFKINIYKELYYGPARVIEEKYFVING